ncbi:HAD family hydrolase [bacterium]|nr:HAD family hydrolase [bacterium]
MKKYSAVIFDLDGTLLNSTKDIVEAVNHTLSHFNLPPREEADVMRFVGKGIKHFITEVLKENNVSIEDAVSIQTNYYETKEIHSSLYPNAESLLKYLKTKNIKIFLVTNKPHQATLKNLDFFNISHYFDAIYGAEALPKQKPNPYSIDFISENFKINKDEMIFVGDSITDSETAQNGDIDFILMNYGFEKKDRRETLKVNYRFDDLSEIMTIL